MAGGKQWDNFYHNAGRRKRARASGQQLVRCLGFVDLVSFGIGNCVGAGLFVTIGPAAVNFAGPAVTLSFLVGGFAAMLTALCYAQLASIPGIGDESGSAYMYVYATVGEFAGFMAGWLVSLGYVIGAAAVARGWVDYAAHLLHDMGWVRMAALVAPRVYLGYAIAPAAAVLCAVLAGIVMMGVRESTAFNNAVTLGNVLLIAFIIGAGAREVDTANWEPYTPFGWEGVCQGAAVVFFAFLGFDASTALGAETVDPARTIPKALVAIITIVALLYIAVALVLTGMLPLKDIKVSAPLASAFAQKGAPNTAILVAAGAVGTTVANTFCAILTQPRIWLCMAQHGLLPPFLAELSPAPRRVPVAGVLTMTVFVMVLASTMDMNVLLGVTSLSCLVVFNGVSSGLLLHSAATEDGRATLLQALPIYIACAIGHGFVLLNGAQLSWVMPTTLALVLSGLAVYRVDVQRKEATFVIPGGALIPMLAMLANSYMTAAMGGYLCLHFLAWVVPGMVFYIFYSQHHSVCGQEADEERAALTGPPLIDQDRAVVIGR